MSDKDIHIHVHGGSSKPSSKASNDTKKDVNAKRRAAMKKSQDALKLHLNEMFKGGYGFFKHFFLALFYALRLLGFALKSHGEAMNRKQEAESKGKKSGPLRW